jgi:predicted enzyme related to lactoylglutathione lyase
MHVDFRSDDREAEVERVVALGASRVGEHDEFGVRWTVLTDPEGNEFCIGEPSGS